MDRRNIVYRGKFHDVELEAVTSEYIRAEASQYFSDPGRGAAVDTEYYFRGKALNNIPDAKREQLDEIIISELEYEIHEEMYRIAVEAREKRGIKKCK